VTSRALHTPQAVWIARLGTFQTIYMKDPPFSIKESLIVGWEAFKVHYRLFAPIVFISIAISLAAEYIGNRDTLGLGLIVMAVGFIAQIIVGMGLIKIALSITAGGTPVFDDIFSPTHLFFSYIGAAVLYALIVLGGFLLLIVPGLIWLVSYWLFQYALIDQERGAFAALAEAKRISRGVRWHLFLLILTTGMLNFAGVLVFFVGLFITIPVTTVATAHIYRQLQKRLEPEQAESKSREALEATPVSLSPEIQSHTF